MSLGEIVSVVNPDGTFVGSAGAPVTGTVTANGGTPPSLANAWNIKITDGIDSANVTPSNFGGSLQVVNGVITSLSSLTAVTTNANGTVADFGASRACATGIGVVTGTLTGTATIQGSHDSTTWVDCGNAAAGSVFTIAAAGTFLLTNINKPFRYYRATLTGAAGTGTLTITIMAS